MASPQVQIALSLWQLQQAKKLGKNLERPVMEVPKAQKEAVGLARSLAGTTRFAGQDEAELALDNQLAGGAANIYDTATSSSEALDALINLNSNRMSAQNDIAQMAAQNYISRKQDLTAELDNLARTQQQMFEHNQVLPYEERRRAVQSMRGAGLENLYGGITAFEDQTKQAGKDLMSLYLGGGISGLGGQGKSTGAEGGGIASGIEKSSMGGLGGSAASMTSIVPSVLSPNPPSDQLTVEQIEAIQNMFNTQWNSYGN